MSKKEILSVSNLSKSFNDRLVIDNLSFKVNEGDFLSIVGTSGCGKTTLLNILSFLDNEYVGEIKRNINKEDIAYMFQDPSLFPWLTLYDNATLGLKIKKINNYNYIDELIKRYGLDQYKHKYPKSLSGGMKQRVSLIRTIAAKPKLLLLDEPFAALDYQTRLLISKDVYDLAKENNISVIMITHDISEAISLSNKVIVLSKRPASIKNTYNIDFKDVKNPINKRTTNLFSTYYKLISEDLDILNE